MATADIGILGGSGLYAIKGLDDVDEIDIQTPFGEPSDRLRVGRLAGRSVAFLARHGRYHHLLPTEINYRANVYAMKALGVTRLISASAVGSLRENIHPLEVVLPDQFIDRTRQRPSTFFGEGIVAHVGFGDPVCAELLDVLEPVGRETGKTIHRGGTYLCMEGPQFSTRAESRAYRAMGCDVIGMTNLQEAKLAREAEMCFATIALVTDYDCWNEAESVSVEVVVRRLHENAAVATQMVIGVVGRLKEKRDCACRDALQNAILTRPEMIPPETRARLEPILARWIGESNA